jgi:hypothetical protein
VVSDDHEDDDDHFAPQGGAWNDHDGEDGEK